MRCLIADDYDDIREMLTAAFEQNGWEVVAAKDGRDALHLYHEAIHQEKYFDLLLLDVNMPRVNGLAVGVNVRNLEKYGDVPRAIHIYFTGDKDVVPPQDLIGSLFADAYIRKPIELDSLIEMIDGLLRRNK